MTQGSTTEDLSITTDSASEMDKEPSKPTPVTVHGPPKHDSTKVALIVTTYFFVSMSLVFANKIILEDDIFPFPLTMTWFQFVLQLVGLKFSQYLGSTSESLRFVPEIPFDWSTAKKVMPVTLVYIGMIVANNICLQYVEVTFYQVARSLTIIFTIAFSYFFLNKKTSVPVVLSCLIVVLGFLLGIKGEINPSVIGVFFGITSSAFTSLNSVVVKKTLSNLAFWDTLYYNTILAILMMLPVMALTGEITAVLQFPTLFDPLVWQTNIVAGVLGFMVSVVIFFQIHYTSALTNNVVGTAKASVQTVLAAFIWKNPITPMNAVGTALVIGGSALYSYFASKIR